MRVCLLHDRWHQYQEAVSLWLLPCAGIDAEAEGLPDAMTLA